MRWWQRYAAVCVALHGNPRPQLNQAGAFEIRLVALSGPTAGAVLCAVPLSIDIHSLPLPSPLSLYVLSRIHTSLTRAARSQVTSVRLAPSLRYVVVGFSGGEGVRVYRVHRAAGVLQPVAHDGSVPGEVNCVLSLPHGDGAFVVATSTSVPLLYGPRRRTPP
jgi:hypothetical protein